MSETDAEWTEQLRANREEKDQFFAEHPQSPVPPEEREMFEGLDYFEPAAACRVEAEATVHEEPDPVEMDTTNGPPVRYLRVATFAFELREADCELHAYRQADDDSRVLFVPFRDKTTGQQSYEGGDTWSSNPTGSWRTATW